MQLTFSYSVETWPRSNSRLHQGYVEYSGRLSCRDCSQVGYVGCPEVSTIQIRLQLLEERHAKAC
jgi:hypothetical protein